MFGPGSGALPVSLKDTIEDVEFKHVAYLLPENDLLPTAVALGVAYNNSLGYSSRTVGSLGRTIEQGAYTAIAAVQREHLPHNRHLRVQSLYPLIIDTG